MRGISGDDPEGGARRGVPRRRLITARPGRHGTPTARHDHLAARSSLYVSGGNSGEGSVGPEPKIATVERRVPGDLRARTQVTSICSCAAGLLARRPKSLQTFVSTT